MKIALIVAVGRDCDRPIIYRGDLVNGFEIAELCTLTTLDQIAGRLADNDRQREHIDVRRWVIEAGREGLTRTAISKRVNGRFDARRLDDILRSLEHDSREVIEVKQAKARGAPLRIYYATEALAANAG